MTWNHDEPEASTSLTRVDNHIYFYCDVERDTTVALLKELRIVAFENLARQGPDGEVAPIWLHIQSDGGLTFSALAIADTIKGMRVPVYSIAEGICASAATVIAAACKLRYARPNAVFLIHQVQGGTWGTFQQMQDQNKMYQMTMDKLKTFYMANSHLSEQQVTSLLERDSWFDSYKAIEYGLVDKII